MLPGSLPHYSIGPFFGFAANAVIAILCLVISALYFRYRPLRSLFLFYIISAFLFLGWAIYGLQASPESILLGYRIDLASVVLLPASWAWFISALFDERPSGLTKTVTGISLCLAALALWGQGPWLLGFPLVPHQIGENILRPESKLLRPLIHFFCLSACLYYFCQVTFKFLRFKGKRPVYLLPLGIGLLFWFLGGLHDGIRSAGVAVPIKGQILWFTSIWLSVFLAIAVALHFRSLGQAIREARDVFERFVPPAYLRRIAAQGLRSIRLGEADQQRVTVLSCDVRGFTALSERMSPIELIALINHLFERITRVVDWRRGVIDKFLGDMVLCIFEGTDSARRAVDCGVDILNVVKSLNKERYRLTDQTIRIGIGLHNGPVILGTIGSPKRMDSTALGFTVNLAKRLEEVTRPLNVDMLISDEVAGQLPKEHGHRFRRLGEVSVKGSLAPVGIVEVYDQDPPEVRYLKDQIGPIVSEGIEFFKAGRLEAAMSNLKRAQVIFPQDLPLRLLTSALQKALEQGQMIEGSALLDLGSK